MNDRSEQAPEPVEEDILEVFRRNTKTSLEHGRHVIRCRKGLWAVDAPDFDTAMREAGRYFVQYYHDGEYDS